MKKVVVVIAAIVGMALAGLGGWYLLNSTPAYPGTSESVIIGVPPNEQSVLILIAEDQGLFAKNGLNATIKTYETALAALEGMKNGEVDVAESAEFPIVREAFKRSDIRVIASIDKFDHIQLVARRDRGIEKVSDLKGKRIGAARGTLTEFYLGRFLSLNGLTLQDVTTVNMGFAESAEALASGSVDAFQVQGKDIAPIKERLDSSKLIVWPSQSGQLGYEVISGPRGWVAGHPEAVTRLLRSLDQAADFFINYPTQALEIVQERLKYSAEYVADIGPQHRYSLSLDQSLITAMEDEARWMISNDLAGEKQVPNFLEYVHEDGLKALKPGAVNISR